MEAKWIIITGYYYYYYQIHGVGTQLQGIKKLHGHTAMLHSVLELKTIIISIPMALLEYRDTRASKTSVH